DDSACLVAAAQQFSRFLAVESCGQCPPCKLGSLEITSRLRRIESGEGTDADISEIGGWLDKVTDGNRCYLAVEERVVVGSILRSFPEEFVAHLDGRGCGPARLKRDWTAAFGKQRAERPPRRLRMRGEGFACSTRRAGSSAVRCLDRLELAPVRAVARSLPDGRRGHDC
ncbi:MAG: hypothetical protein M3133_03915, partial [Actinomycetota bacterium]|nr:hypothetical protein [Actinomycetota bacterium]